MKTLSPRTGIAGVAIATLVLLAGVASNSLYAQSLEDKIGSALQAKKPLTRGLSIDPQASADKQAIDKLRTRSIRDRKSTRLNSSHG